MERQNKFEKEQKEFVEKLVRLNRTAKTVKVDAVCLSQLLQL